MLRRMLTKHPHVIDMAFGMLHIYINRAIPGTMQATTELDQLKVVAPRGHPKAKEFKTGFIPQGPIFSCLIRFTKKDPL